MQRSPCNAVGATGLFLLAAAISALGSGCNSRSAPPALDVMTDVAPQLPVLAVRNLQDDSSADHPALQEPISITGVVVTTPLFATSNTSPVVDGFFVADPEGGEYSGIHVQAIEPALADGPLTLQPGDLVEIRGLYEEFYGFSMIAATAVIVLGTSDLPEPTIVATSQICTTCPDAERFESVVVGLEDVVVTNADLGYGNFGVQPVGGGIEMIVSPKFDFNHQYQPTQGDTFTRLSGVLDFSWDEFRLQPRDAGDFVLGSGGR